MDVGTVRSEDWKPMLRARKLKPGVPALTDLAARTSFFEEAWLAGSIGRVSELLAVWRMGRENAIRHELGHALCDDINEAKRRPCGDPPITEKIRVLRSEGRANGAANQNGLGTANR
jgi:hypothetical protein